eukprot:scpid65632/ scgid33835/ 
MPSWAREKTDDCDQWKLDYTRCCQWQRSVTVAHGNQALLSLMATKRHCCSWQLSVTVPHGNQTPPSLMATSTSPPGYDNSMRHRSCNWKLTEYTNHPAVPGHVIAALATHRNLCECYSPWMK